MARFPGGEEGVAAELGLPEGTDESSVVLQVLDELQEWLEQKRAELELGPLKPKPADIGAEVPALDVGE